MLKNIHVNELFEEILKEYPMEIAIEGQVHLERYLKYYDPNLYEIYIGKANLSDFYKILNDTNIKVCPRRETLNNSLFHICDYVLELKKIGLEMENFDQDFDAFMRTILGWSPLVVNTKGEAEPLRPNELIQNRFKDCQSNNEIIALLIEHEHVVLDKISFEQLKRSSPEFATKAKQIVLAFTEKHKLEINTLYLGETTFKSTTLKKNNLMYHAYKKICHHMKENNGKSIDEFSDVLETELKGIFGLPNVI